MKAYHEQRVATEAEITAALRELNQEQQARLKRYLGNPPSFENVPETFWQEIQEEHAALLFLLMVSISGRSARYSRDRFQSTGLHVPDEQIDKQVADYSADRAAEVSAGTVDGIKNRVKRYFDAMENPDRKQVDEDLPDLFGEKNVGTVSRTETTAAVSNGEGIIVDDAKQQGKQVKVVWRIDPMSNVCPICSKMNGKQEEYWRRYFPLGPPAHPNCACDLEVIIDGISAGSFLPDIGINPVAKIWIPKVWKPKLWAPNLVG